MSHRPALSRAVLALALAAVLAQPAAAFQVQKHAAITKQVLGRHGLSGAALSLVAFGAMLPDILDCVGPCYCDFAPGFCQPSGGEIQVYAANHFDNNLLDESAFRANALMDQAQAGIVTSQGNSRASGIALLAFGRALHTAQDFYAHSTFVEINLFPGPFITTHITAIPIWYGEPYALYQWSNNNTSGFGDLQTGFYIAPTPFSGYSHDVLNKDSAGSPEGSQTARVNGAGPTPKLYGVASGDFSLNGNYNDLGLAPQHTIYGYQALLAGGLIFPYQFGPRTAAIPAGADFTQRALEFFSWVNQDSTLIAMAAQAESLITRADADSIGDFPIDQIDADGLPLPPVVSVRPGAPGPVRMAPVFPNPTRDRAHIAFRTPGPGVVRIGVYDVEGRFVARVFEGDPGEGVHDLHWDCRDEGGSPVPPGVYLVRYSGHGHSESRRFVITR